MPYDKAIFANDAHNNVLEVLASTIRKKVNKSYIDWEVKNKPLSLQMT